MTALVDDSIRFENNTLRLSNAEIEQFALQGYLVKKNVLNPEKTGKTIDIVWDNMPDYFDRRYPLSWRGKVTDCGGNLSISARYGKVKLRDQVWGNKILDDLSIRDENIFRMIEQLLGTGNVVRPERFRGLYPTFPTPEHKGVPVRAHVDVTNIPFKVSVAAYLGDVPPNGGGLMVWPESHRTLYYDYETASSLPENITTKPFRRDFALINSIKPVEIPGKAGDIILFHYCLMHAAGINTIDGHVRNALFFNYRSTQCDDTMRDPRPDDIWEGWEGIRKLNSAKIRESSRPPADPLLGNKSVPGRALMIFIARGQRRMLKMFG